MSSSNTKTVISAKYIHGIDPQRLVEKIIRERIYESQYFKEQCNTLSVEDVIELGQRLTHIGGIFSNIKPVPFICLLQKLLQIQPNFDRLRSLLIDDTSSKYLVALILLYSRITLNSLDAYILIEPYLSDFRRIRTRSSSGLYCISTMDQFTDALLTKDRVCDIILPRLTKRIIFEKEGKLEPKFSFDSLEINFNSNYVDESSKLISSTIIPSKNSHEHGNDFFSGSAKHFAPSEVRTMSVDETNALRVKLGLRPLI